MSRLDDHNRELRRLLTFVAGFGLLSAATYAVPGSEEVRPWMPGEPVPLVHLLTGDSVVVETHPGVLVSRSADAAGAPPDLGDTGAPFEEDDALDPEAAPAVALAAPAPAPTVDAADGEAAPAPEAPDPAAPPEGAAEAEAVAQADDASDDAPEDAPPEVAPPADADAEAADAEEAEGDALALLVADPPLAPLADDSAAPEDTGKPEPRPTTGPPHDPHLPDRAPAWGTPLENAGALDAWFTALSRAQAGEAGFIARALHWGDSTIAGDGITRTVRRRLQGRFGDGGPGFLSVQVDRRWASRPGVARSTKGDWDTLTITFGGAEMAYYGLAGTVSTAQGASSSTLGGLKLEDGSRQPLHRFDVFFQVQPGGGSFSASARGGPSMGFSTASEWRGDAFKTLEVPEGAETLTVSTAGDGPVSLYGVALETAGPGMTWETLGVAGAGPGSMFRQGKNHLARQIAHRDPHLLVYQMGGNELGLPSLKSGDGHIWKERYIKVVRRLQAGAPDASCLLITPLDQGERHRGVIRSKPTLDRMVQLQREAAFEVGCAFWDARSAMGGSGAFARWLSHEPALAWSDLSHLTNRGLNIMGHTLADAMERSYDQWQRGNPPPARLVKVE